MPSSDRINKFLLLFVRPLAVFYKLTSMLFFFPKGSRSFLPSVGSVSYTLPTSLFRL